MKKFKKCLLLIMLLVAIGITVPVYGSRINVSMGTTEDGDFVTNNDIMEYSGRVVARNMYIGDNATYTFYGNLTVNGDLYILGSFYNYGTINVSGTVYCRNYYNNNVLEKRASHIVDGQIVYYPRGNFYNKGTVNSKGIEVADLYDVKVPVPTVSGCTIGQHEPGPAATCTTPQKCTECGKVLKAALGHKPGAKATCTKPQKCTVCGAILVKSGDHTPGAEATCTEPQKCLECGKVLVQALGHKWSDWETEKSATVMSRSEMARYCLRCGSIEVKYGDTLTPTGDVNYKSVILQKRKNTSAVKITGMAKGDYLKSVIPKNTKLVKISNIKQDGTFKITALKKTGKTTITATLASGFTVNINLTVQSKAVKTTKLTVNKTVVNLTKGKSFTLKVSKTPFNASDKISFTSSNKKIATVNKKGKIVAKKKGTAYITVKALKISKKVKVVVKNKSDSNSDFIS